MERVVISHGRWIRLQQLESIKADSIVIWEVSLTDDQVNAFLRDWKESEAESNWKQLKIHFNRVPELHIVLEELDVTNEHHMRPDDVIGQWSFNRRNGKKCTVVYTEYESDVVDFGFEFHLEN